MSSSEPNAHVISGQAFAPGTSHARPAQLHLNASRTLVWIVTHDDGRINERHQLKRIDLEPQLGRLEARITFPDGWLFITNDTTVFDRLGSDRFSHFRHKIQAFSPRLIGVFAGCILGIIAIWKYLIPVLATVAVWMTPPAAVHAIETASLRSIDLTIANPSRLTPEDTQKYIAVFETLTDHIPQQQKFTFNMVFRDIPGVGPNAFALPGGTMVLTDALIDEFGQDLDLIAGVIGHEIGHVVDQHGLNLLYRSLSLYIVASLFAGDIGPILDEIMLEGQTVLTLVFSKRYETDADQFALDLLVKSGMDPTGLRRFFEALEKYDLPSDLLSSHPLSSDRIKAIDAFMAQLPAGSR